MVTDYSLKILIPCFTSSFGPSFLWCIFLYILSLSRPTFILFIYPNHFTIFWSTQYIEFQFAFISLSLSLSLSSLTHSRQSRPPLPAVFNAKMLNANLIHKLTRAILYMRVFALTRNYANKHYGRARRPHHALYLASFLLNVRRQWELLLFIISR